MIKHTIPIMLVATVMVAGIFAMLPVEKASAVHTTIQANSMELVRATEVAANFIAAVDDGVDMEIVSTAPFCVVAFISETTIDNADDLGFSSIQIDNVNLDQTNGDDFADANVTNTDLDNESIVVDWVDAIRSTSADVGVHSLCANLEFDIIINETGTVVNTEIVRITAYVLTTGDATVTVDIAAAD